MIVAEISKMNSGTQVTASQEYMMVLTPNQITLK